MVLVILDAHLRPTRTAEILTYQEFEPRVFGRGLLDIQLVHIFVNDHILLMVQKSGVHQLIG